MTSFTFRTHEYYHRHKTTDWYWTVGIIAVAAAAISIILSNVLLGVLILIGVFSLLIHAARPPHEHDVTISDGGITIDKYRYSYSIMQSFWLEHYEAPRLLIRTNRTLMPHIIIPVEALSEEEKEEIRHFLATKMPEKEQTEPLLEQVMEYLGF